MSNTPIVLKLGERGQKYLERNKLDKKNHTDKQPAGINFYEKHWDSKSTGSAHFEHGKFSFDIPFVLSVVGMEDTDRADEGISNFDIYAKITEKNTIQHDTAKKEFFDFLRSLASIGWKQEIHYSMPRLTGMQGYMYTKEEDNYYGLPIDYEPSMDEWMELPRKGLWFFYADNVFLKIRFQREEESTDPEKQAYIFTLNAYTGTVNARGEFFNEAAKNQWQELWVDRIKSLKRERYQKEAELIKRGYTIYTDYQEPKIHPLDPVEP